MLGIDTLIANILQKYFNFQHSCFVFNRNRFLEHFPASVRFLCAFMSMSMLTVDLGYIEQSL